MRQSGDLVDIVKLSVVAEHHKTPLFVLSGADNIKSRIIFVCDRKVENGDPVLDTLAVCCFSLHHFVMVCETGVRLGIELHHETVLGILSLLLLAIRDLKIRGR